MHMFHIWVALMCNPAQFNVWNVQVLLSICDFSYAIPLTLSDFFLAGLFELFLKKEEEKECRIACLIMLYSGMVFTVAVSLKDGRFE